MKNTCVHRIYEIRKKFIVLFYTYRQKSFRNGVILNETKTKKNLRILKDITTI